MPHRAGATIYRHRHFVVGLILTRNRERRSIIVLSIVDARIRPVATIDVGDKAVAAAIAANGRYPLVAKNKAAQVGGRSIDGSCSVRYELAYDRPSSARVSGLDVTLDGTLTLAGNTGPELRDGHADTISIINADGSPRLSRINLGSVIPPDERHVAILVGQGSSEAHMSRGAAKKIDETTIEIPRHPVETRPRSDPAQ